ncbi:MAG: 5'-methylthioadenosine/S-adenosylhomocysteine nucleosidase [Clostridia bacterium]|nr:5'-methylthioadenosine/S-adenosylhomocysteine nucleosidase [Clostridia bacterium]
MIGISVAESNEWETTLKYFNKNHEECEKFPFGEYFFTEINNKKVIVYRCYIRKVASAASTQYMIDKFDLEKIVVAGTCAGVDNTFKQYDIIIPNKAVQYDCTVRETEPLIKEKFNVDIDLSDLEFNYKTGIIGTADKPLVMWNDYLILKDNNITIVDTEASGIAYVCKMNHVEVLIVKGISDFPTDESKTTKELSHEEQYNIFIKNIPIVMNKIFDDYIEKVI